MILPIKDTQLRLRIWDGGDIILHYMHLRGFLDGSGWNISNPSNDLSEIAVQYLPKSWSARNTLWEAIKSIVLLPLVLRILNSVDIRWREKTGLWNG